MHYKPEKFLISELSTILSNALAEDIGGSDITSGALLKDNRILKAQIVSKENNVIVCGLGVVRGVFKQLDKNIKIIDQVKDGQEINKGKIVITIIGPAVKILNGERTALNFLGKLSGIATKTRRLVKKVSKYKVKILDTRKTTPGLRILEKYAVRIGGGYNHRFGLFDQVLIKDNHIRILKKTFPGIAINDIILMARKNIKQRVPIEIEVKNIQELKLALTAGPDIVMLDNMSITQIRKSVLIKNKCNKKIKLEASGNINEKDIVSIASSGVDFMSLGGLTHSTQAVDYSLNVV